MIKNKQLYFILPLLALLLIPSCAKKEGDEIAVKIDDDKITIDQFYKFYYTQNKLIMNMDKKEIDKLADDPTTVNHPTINKTRFMDFLISRKLLFKKAKKDESIDKDELETIIELSKMQAAATYYIMEKLKDDVSVTEEEIDDFYNKNRKLFKGIPIDDNVVSRIKQQLFLQKLELKSSQFILDLIAESKVNREGFKKHMNKKKKGAEKEKKKKESSE